MLHDRQDSGGVNHHEVDLVGTGGNGIAEVAGTVVQRDGGVEPGLGDRDDPHIVVHIHIVVHVLVAVHDHTSHAALDKTVNGRADEQDTALIGDFVIVHGDGGRVDSGDGVRGGGQIGGSAVNVGGGGHGREAVGIKFGDLLGPHELTDQSAECHAKGLFVIHQFCYRKGFLSSASYGFPYVQHIFSTLSVVPASWRDYIFSPSMRCPWSRFA